MLMVPIEFLVVAAGVPILLAVLLRVNAAILFMSLCLGAVLVQYTTSDTSAFVGSVAPQGNIGQNLVRIALLFLPMALTMLFMFHSVKGGTKALLNIIPAIALGLLSALLVEPFLSSGLRGNIERSPVWHQFIQAQTLIIGFGAAISLLFLWLHRGGGGEKGKHVKHH